MAGLRPHTGFKIKRFDRVDVILLVNNAQQPMQAAPLSVLCSVATSGHSKKLAVAFTHFDQIKGPTLRTSADKRNHVMASVLNALFNLRDALGASVIRSIEHDINKKCFILGGVDQNIRRLPARAAGYMREELTGLEILQEGHSSTTAAVISIPHLRPHRHLLCGPGCCIEVSCTLASSIRFGCL